MKVKDVKLPIVKKENYYTGSGYRTKYWLTNETVVLPASYSKMPVEKAKCGFIANGSNIENFYIYQEGYGFKTYSPNEYDKFLVDFKVS